MLRKDPVRQAGVVQPCQIPSRVLGAGDDDAGELTIKRLRHTAGIRNQTKVRVIGNMGQRNDGDVRSGVTGSIERHAIFGIESRHPGRYGNTPKHGLPVRCCSRSTPLENSVGSPRKRFTTNERTSARSFSSSSAKVPTIDAKTPPRSISAVNNTGTFKRVARPQIH